MQFTRTVFVLSLTLFIVITIPSAIVHAQEFEGLQLQPAIMDVPIKKGADSVSLITLFNNSSESLAITAGSRSLIPEDNFIDETAAERYNTQKWIKLSVKDFLLSPGESREVEVTISAPNDAAPGGHYALVTFKVINSDLNSSGVQLNTEAAAVVLLNVPGAINEAASVVNDRSSGVAVGGSVAFPFAIKNLGNSHITPIITTDILNSAGEVVDSVIQPVQLLLPNTKRNYIVNWDSNGLVGHYSSVTKMTYGTPTQLEQYESSAVLVLPRVELLLLFFMIMTILIKILSKRGAIKKLKNRLVSTNNKKAVSVGKKPVDTRTKKTKK